MLTIAGVHPYADKFPMLPEPGTKLVGVGSSPHFFVVTVIESDDHPGYYDASVTGCGSIVSTERPCSSRDLIAEMVRTETRSAALRWRYEDAETEAHKTRAPAPRTGEPSVYFIADEDGYVKIGTARNVNSRLASLQTASRQKLIVLGFTPGNHEDERRYHEMFAVDRVRGEWFRPSVKLMHGTSAA